MKTIHEQWYTELENLIFEIMVAEKAYGTLVQSDRYPSKRPFFMKRHFKLQKSAHTLAEEFYIIQGRKPSKIKNVHKPLFSSMEKSILEDNLTDMEIDYIIIEKEQALIVLYQKVLMHNELPGTTDAILQSQAEEQNSLLQDLLLDYRINIRRESTII